MTDAARWAGSIALSFLAGSIPFGLLIARAKGVDIRLYGSKNIGATNVWRVLGRGPGLLCFELDVLKGAAPVALAGLWLGVFGDRAMPPRDAGLWMAVAAAAMLGHMFTPFAGFKGGKGVATGLGACAALWPAVSIAAAAALLAWIIAARATRYVGLSSCIAAGVLPLAVALAHAAGLAGDAPDAASRAAQGWPFIAMTAALGALVIWKHRANLARTIAGTEPRIGERAPPPTSESR